MRMAEDRPKKTVFNLEKSPYCADASGHKFYFSSERRKDKFLYMLRENRIKVSETMSKRYKFPIKLDLLADIYLYRCIEDRGFYITNNEGEFQWHQLCQLSGGKLTRKQYVI